MAITPAEYDYLEKYWSELFKQRRELEKKINAVNKEIEKVEKKLRQPIIKNK